jgi:hypothetical protein
VKQEPVSRIFTSIVTGGPVIHYWNATKVMCPSHGVEPSARKPSTSMSLAKLAVQSVIGQVLEATTT